MNWETVVEQLQTKNIILHLTAVDPLSLATNPYVIVTAIAVFGALTAMKMIRTLGSIVAVVILWCGVYYAFPHQGLEIELRNLGVFSGFALSAIALLVYVYLIRGD